MSVSEAAWSVKSMRSVMRRMWMFVARFKQHPRRRQAPNRPAGRQEAQDFAATPETFGPNTSNFAGAGMVGTMGFNARRTGWPVFCRFQEAKEKANRTAKSTNISISPNTTHVKQPAKPSDRRMSRAAS